MELDEETILALGFQSFNYDGLNKGRKNIKFRRKGPDPIKAKARDRKRNKRKKKRSPGYLKRKRKRDRERAALKRAALNCKVSIPPATPTQGSP